MNDATKIYQLYAENAAANEQSQMHVDSYGTKMWLNQHMRLHRVHGPAIEYADGAKEWRVHSKRHREDGAAVEYADGAKEWWLHGKEYENVAAWAKAVLKMRNKPHDDDAVQKFVRMILTKDDLI